MDPVGPPLELELLDEDELDEDELEDDGLAGHAASCVQLVLLAPLH